MFVDPVSATRIEVEVCATDSAAARERAWAALRANRERGVVVVDLIDVRPVKEEKASTTEADHERTEGPHPPR